MARLQSDTRGQPLPALCYALMLDKSSIVSAWREILRDRLAVHESSKLAARSGTRVDGEHRPSNRGERAAVTTQGYLAHAFGARTIELQDYLEALEDMGSAPRSEVVIGAVLTLSMDEQPAKTIALLPGGDATQLKLVSGTVTVLSTSSPLAAQLRDSEAGDSLEVEIGGRVIEVEIIAID